MSNIIWKDQFKNWLDEPFRFSDDSHVVIATVSKKRFYKMLVEDDIITEKDFTFEDFLKVVKEDYISYREEEDDIEFEDWKARWLGAKPRSKWSHKVWVR